MIVADIPDISIHFFENLYCLRINGVKKLCSAVLGCVLLNGRNRPLNIRYNVICTMQKLKNFIRNKCFVIPLAVHISVKTDITGKNKS